MQFVKCRLSFITGVVLKKNTILSLKLALPKLSVNDSHQFFFNIAIIFQNFFKILYTVEIAKKKAI